jgi:hypothetical protein
MERARESVVRAVIGPNGEKEATAALANDHLPRWLSATAKRVAVAATCPFEHLSKLLGRIQIRGGRE